MFNLGTSAAWQTLISALVRFDAWDATGGCALSYWLIGLLIWIAPALLLGCALLWVRFKTSPAANATSDNAQPVNAANDAEQALPQFAVMVAAE